MRIERQTVIIALPAAALAAILAASAARASDIDLTSRIEAVTVYPDGALVSRAIRADVPVGSHALVLKGLPAGIDPNSLRVEGTGALSIVSVDLKPVAADPNAHADPARALRIEALKADLSRLAGVIEAAEGQKAAIRRFAETGPDKLGADGKAMEIADWPKAWAAIGDGLTAINARLRDLRAENERLEAELAALKQVGRLSPRFAAPANELRLVVEAGEASEARLTLRYQLRAAGWTPLYDAALATQGRARPTLDLTRRARVVQTSGEDWQDIALTLSTVRLNRGTAAPTVNVATLSLRELEPVPEPLARATLQKAAPPAVAASPAPPSSGETQPQDAFRLREQNAGIEAGAYQASFLVPGKVSVPEDGTEKSFALASRALDPDLVLKVAPSLDQTGYIEAGFLNEDEVPLLAGPVVLHRDGVLIGRGQVPLVAPGDKVTLGFGADDALKVTRVALKKRASDNGWIGSSRTDTQEWKTTIRNLHDFPVKIAVVDRLPVSENIAITVEPLSTNTPPTDKAVDEKRGVMGWSYEMKPAETREIRLGWRVRWPGDRDLVTRTN